MNLKFSGRGLAFLAHFMADQDIRYYLNGIHFEPMPAECGGGVLAAATNGHVMGMWHDKEGICSRPVIAKVSKPLIAACRKTIKGRGEAYLEVLDGRLAAARYEEIDSEPTRIAELYVQPQETTLLRDGQLAWEIEGKFPDLQRVVRKRSEYTQGFVGCVQAQYFELIGKAIKDGSRPERRKFWAGVKMAQENASSMVLVMMQSLPEALAIIMPMREDSEYGAAWHGAWKRHGERVAAASAAPLPAMPSDAAPPPDFQPWRIPENKGRRA